MFCSFKHYCTVEIWISKQKKKINMDFLKIRIKDSFSILFSPIIDGKMYIKVKSYVTFKNFCQI